MPIGVLTRKNFKTFCLKIQKSIGISIKIWTLKKFFRSIVKNITESFQKTFDKFLMTISALNRI